ncbi:hypothetical protein [Oceanobacter kriegii]|uniref:hypothetical protein n=1 Tax=Oceanobacter kriegii TaxID=64972 RepID=UPI000407F5EA|nr:hypothetical protein [Oceanobacter kriegii]
MANTAPDAPHTIASRTSSFTDTTASKNQQAIANTALIFAAFISFAAALARHPYQHRRHLSDRVGFCTLCLPLRLSANCHL